MPEANKNGKTWGYVANTQGIMLQDKLVTQEQLEELDVFLENLSEVFQDKIDNIKPKENFSSQIIYPALLPVLHAKC